LSAENFVPITAFGSEIFDSLEREHANNMLNVAVLSESEFLLQVKECDSVFSLLESSMLREWSKASSSKKPSSKVGWFSDW
jgi:hypothetical protein